MPAQAGIQRRRPYEKCASGMSTYPLGGEQQSQKCVRLNVESIVAAAKAEPQRVPLSHEVGKGQGEGLSSRSALSVMRHCPHPNPLPQAGEGDAVALLPLGAAAGHGVDRSLSTDSGGQERNHHRGHRAPPRAPRPLLRPPKRLRSEELRRSKERASRRRVRVEGRSSVPSVLSVVRSSRLDPRWAWGASLVLPGAANPA